MNECDYRIDLVYEHKIAELNLKVQLLEDLLEIHKIKERNYKELINSLCKQLGRDPIY